MVEGIGKNIAAAFFAFAIFAFIVGAIIVGIFWWIFSDSTIKSDKPIKPEIELTTDGKTVDTVYIYRQSD